MPFDLEHVDVDHAVRDGAEEAFGDTRLSFLRKSALAGGAAIGGGALLSALVPGAAKAATFGAPPANPFGTGDVGILNYALTLEYLERDYYEAVLSRKIVKSGPARKYLNTVVRDERAHVAFLKAGLGSAALPQPTFNFHKYLKDEKTFLETSYLLENTGVHAYLGQAGNISNPTYLYDAATILTIEARHAGAVAMLTYKPIDINKDFDQGASASTILAAVNSLHVIK